MRELEDPGRFSITYGQTDTPGLYRLDLNRSVESGGIPAEDAAKSDSVEYFSVNISTDESDLRGIDASELETHFGVESGQFVDYSEKVENRRQEQKQLLGREFWKYCLAAVIALLLLETALAQFFGRRAG